MPLAPALALCPSACSPAFHSGSDSSDQNHKRLLPSARCPGDGQKAVLKWGRRHQFLLSSGRERQQRAGACGSARSHEWQEQERSAWRGGSAYVKGRREEQGGRHRAAAPLRAPEERAANEGLGQWRQGAAAHWRTKQGAEKAQEQHLLRAQAFVLKARSSGTLWVGWAVVCCHVGLGGSAPAAVDGAGAHAAARRSCC